MPSGKPVNWAQYDHLFRRYLPKMTLEEFTTAHLPHISSKAVGARARKLGIRPAPYKPSAEHKQAIAATVSTITPEIVDTIRQMRQTHSLKAIAKAVKRGVATVWRVIEEHGIELTKEGRQRATAASTAGHIGKVPWNKGLETPQDVRDYIGQQVSGELNGQYGRGMTEEEKVRWRRAYFASGVYKVREWLQSPAGKEALSRMIATIRTPEFRAASSKRTVELIKSGKLKPFSGCQGWHKSNKIIGPNKGEGFYRSSYELRYFQLLDQDDDVVAYEVEPFSIEYEFLGAILNYTPDVLVYFADGRLQLVEVKPKSQLTWDKNVAKIRAATAYCDGRQIEFATITEDDLP